MKHPLHTHGKQARYGDSIFEAEKVQSVGSMIGFCEMNIKKYKERLGKKSHIHGIVFRVIEDMFKCDPKSYQEFLDVHMEEVKESDKNKIETYVLYLDILKIMAHRGHAKLTVSHAFDLENIVHDRDVV